MYDWLMWNRGVRGNINIGPNTCTEPVQRRRLASTPIVVGPTNTKPFKELENLTFTTTEAKLRAAVSRVAHGGWVRPAGQRSCSVSSQPASQPALPAAAALLTPRASLLKYPRSPRPLPLRAAPAVQQPQGPPGHLQGGHLRQRQQEDLPHPPPLHWVPRLSGLCSGRHAAQLASAAERAVHARCPPPPPPQPRGPPAEPPPPPTHPHTPPHTTSSAAHGVNPAP